MSTEIKSTFDPNDYTYTIGGAEQPQTVDQEKFDLMRMQLEEEINELKDKVKKYEEGYLQSKGLPKEFDSLVNYFPPRGEQFCFGKIERSSAVDGKFTVNFSTNFSVVPKIMVCTLFPKVNKINANNITATESGFDMKVEGLPVLEHGSFYFWMAYCPMIPKSEKLTQIVEKLKGVKVMSEKEAESQISKYIKKFGVNDEDVNGRTFLYYACEKGYKNLVEFLIQKGANVNCCDENRYSPLHKALSVEKIDPAIVNLLLDHGADRALKNERMNTPLHYLCRVKNLKDYFSILQAIVNKGSAEDTTNFINIANSSGETVLNIICSNSMDLESIKFLCEKGADANHQANNETFPLYNAVMKGNTELIDLLLKYGASVGQTYKGKPLSDVAAEKGQMEKLVNIIKERYSDGVLSDETITKVGSSFLNIPFPVERWTDSVMKTMPLLVDMETLPLGSKVENFYTCTTHKYEGLLVKGVHDPQSCIPYYQKNFTANDHNNYVIKTDNDVTVFSISDEKTNRKVIMRNKRSDTRLVYENKSDYQIIKEYFPELKEKALTPMRGDAVFNSLVKFENFFTYQRYKFGVLYGSPGQTKEMDFFNNREGSSYFEHFLSNLGQKVELFGYTGFAGGLDTKNRLMGEYTYVNTFSKGNVQVVYHIAPYLPFMETNDQQLDKKRHIGNDVVVLIFKEYAGTPDPIDIESFKTQFNHCFVIVGFDTTQKNPPEKYEYSVNICCKKDVAPVAPFITSDKYIHGDGFSKFIVSKLINAERAAQDSPTFRAKRLAIRQNQLEAIASIAAKK
ncbi:rap GTPase-activating protein, putative [Entamoeba invadens IP1]|uniref:rap GTPase-activating protein, putative n=1 Tax=Entamoeba invadens IP1 TaxID=370355 RepID=UPI0002C3CF6C|nr:rap GTPase-activating protein, putative [Entamoeba invadens IP1]ELP85400.1 rap GTPase-activating protein, putative [Entamoeba invadens IP1]|eukprot:XP_004184746.1 rap GTPase-activating protein, putative [Entamoeba invadens IP1]